jgi:hypothetical protein
MMKEGSFKATIKVPLRRPETSPIVIARIIIHGPPSGNTKAATIAEEDNIDPTERSILPIIMGKVSPAATRRKTVDIVRIPVIFLMLANGGIKMEKIRNTMPNKAYGKTIVSFSKRVLLFILEFEINAATPLSEIEG